jgi:hypothetical protein
MYSFEEELHAEDAMMERFLLQAGIGHSEAQVSCLITETSGAASNATSNTCGS